MSCEEFERAESEKRRLLMAEAQVVADKAYNKGLWGALWWRAPWLYPLFKRRAE